MTMEVECVTTLEGSIILLVLFYLFIYFSEGEKKWGERQRERERENTKLTMCSVQSPTRGLISWS